MLRLLFSITGLFVCLSVFSMQDITQDKHYIVHIETSMGTMKARLYNDTPGHRDHFLRLARSGHYDGTLFYRVMPGFMIQGGSSDTRNAQAGTELGYGREILIDAEIKSGHFHKKGALAAPRQPDETNPKKKSDISQFFIVQGRIYPPEELKAMENKVNVPIKRAAQKKYLTKEKEALLDSLKAQKKVAEFREIAEEIKKQIAEELASNTKMFIIPDEVKQAYTTIGGAHHLDNEYSIFGEVFEGLEIIDKIASMKTDKNNRPLTDVKIIRITVIEP